MKHDAWTELFDNYPAPQVAKLFSQYWREFGLNSNEALRKARRSALCSLQEYKLLCEFAEVYSESELKEVDRLLQECKDRSRKIRSWLILFRGKHLEEIVKEINEIWLDPEYRLVVDAVIEGVGIKKSF